MKEKTKLFQSSAEKLKQNLEITNAKEQVLLLKKYKLEKNKEIKEKIYNELSFEVKLLLKNFKPEYIIKKLEKAIQLDDFRPRNLSIYTFAMDPDLNYVNGEFSTFDEFLSAMIRNNENPNKVRKYAAKEIYNRINVAKQYANDINKILDEYPAQKKQALNSYIIENTNAYTNLLQTISDKLCEDLKIVDRPIIKVIDFWDELPKYFPKLNNTETLYGIHFSYKIPGETKYHTEIYIARQMLYNYIDKKTKKELFKEIISTFAHEFGHAVDNLQANKGALGNQKANIGKKIYVQASADKEKQYHTNPTEVSSETIYNEVLKSLDRI